MPATTLVEEAEWGRVARVWVWGPGAEEAELCRVRVVVVVDVAAVDVVAGPGRVTVRWRGGGLLAVLADVVVAVGACVLALCAFC